MTTEAYTIADFCRVFGVGKTTTYAEINAGRLKARKVTPKKTVISAVDAKAWLDAMPAIQPKKAA